MISKWYISTLVVLLALLGLHQERAKVANQQIAIEFTQADATSVTSCDEALATITEKLVALGVTGLEIIESDDTRLIIRYYSAIDAHSVGEFLSGDGEFSLSYENTDGLPDDLPEDELPESFNLVISDLQQNTGDGLGLNGKFAFEIRQDYHPYSTPVVYYFNDSLALGQEVLTKVALSTHQVIAIAIDNTSHIIPEVRAGPHV